MLLFHSYYQFGRSFVYVQGGPDRNQQLEDLQPVEQGIISPEALKVAEDVDVQRLDERNCINDALQPQVQLDEVNPSETILKRYTKQQIEEGPDYDGVRSFMLDSQNKQLGPFQLQETLGKGGFGEVYKALDTRLGREVAIKVIKPEPLNYAEFWVDKIPKAIAEARKMASFSHGNITPVHDIGIARNESGYPEGIFMVMSLSREKSLQEKLDEIGSMDEEQKLDLADKKLVGTMEALQVLHQKGMIHRDLKPDNILISDAGYYQLTDFGLVQLTESYQGEKILEPEEEEGSIIGTPAFMSPEQALGNADFRSDLFSYGLTLYTLLTGGKMGFEGKSLIGIMSRIVDYQKDSHTKQQEWEQSLVEAKVSPNLRKYILQLLAPKPEDRPQNYAEDFKKAIALDKRYFLSFKYKAKKIASSARRNISKLGKLLPFLNSELPEENIELQETQSSVAPAVDVSPIAETIDLPASQGENEGAELNREQIRIAETIDLPSPAADAGQADNAVKEAPRPETTEINPHQDIPEMEFKRQGELVSLGNRFNLNTRQKFSEDEFSHVYRGIDLQSNKNIVITVLKNQQPGALINLSSYIDELKLTNPEAEPIGIGRYIDGNNNPQVFIVTPNRQIFDQIQDKIKQGARSLQKTI